VNSTIKSFSVTNTQAYSYYRFVINRLNGNTGYGQVAEWILNGKHDIINTFSGGNAIINGSISARNMGMFRNLIINGDMTIDQRSNGASFTVPNGTFSLGSCDRYKFYNENTFYTAQQVTISDLPYFSKALKIMCTQAVASSSGFAFLSQYIEYNNIANLNLGTSNSLSTSLSCWLKSSIIGTFHARLQYVVNTTRISYLVPVRINVANTWEYKTFSIPQSTTYANTASTLFISFTIQQGSPTSSLTYTWTQNNNYSSTDQVQFCSTLNNTLYLTGLQYEIGTISTPFEFRPSAIELQLCKRYYELVSNGNITFYGTSWFASFFFQVEKRVIPSTFNTGNVSFLTPGVSNFYPPSNAVFGVNAANTNMLAVYLTNNLTGAPAGTNGAFYVIYPNSYIRVDVEI
jgi:hypothetical protein